MVIIVISPTCWLGPPYSFFLNSLSGQAERENVSSISLSAGGHKYKPGIKRLSLTVGLVHRWESPLGESFSLHTWIGTAGKLVYVDTMCVTVAVWALLKWPCLHNRHKQWFLKLCVFEYVAPKGFFQKFGRRVEHCSPQTAKLYLPGCLLKVHNWNAVTWEIRMSK